MDTIGVAVGAVYGEPCSAVNSLVTGKITGNFPCFDDQICALVRQTPHAEPFSSPRQDVRHEIEHGINRAVSGN